LHGLIKEEEEEEEEEDVIQAKWAFL